MGNRKSARVAPALPPTVDLSELALCAGVFDLLPDVVFFAKDLERRYIAVNETLVARLGCSKKDEVVGRTARDMFPAALGAVYEEQDRRVVERGEPIQHRIELHLYQSGRRGWCATHKLPIKNHKGAVAGLVGVSRDLQELERTDSDMPGLAGAVAHMQEHFDERLRIADMAERAGMSLGRFERNIRRIFGITPQEMLHKLRIDAAVRGLANEDTSIADIAVACGYSDHSAFSRCFRASIGMPPSEFRALVRSLPDGE